MGLVEYSDSESEEEQTLAQSRNQTLPELPANFLDLYSSTVRTSTRDDPSLHGGRKRVTPHVEGNWPAHVYLEWYPSKSELEALSHIASKAHGAVHSLLHNELGVALPLHVSLSRPLVLRTEQKSGFQARLEASVRACRLSTFEVSIRSVEWHPNEQFSRYFLVLRLTQPDNQLSRLLSACNTVATEFNLPLLYASTSASDHSDCQDQFHISIAWALPQADMGSIPIDCSIGTTITLSAVKIRVGQEVSIIQLAK